MIIAGLKRWSLNASRGDGSRSPRNLLFAVEIDLGAPATSDGARTTSSHNISFPPTT
jgi:hypothetical protein